MTDVTFSVFTDRMSNRWWRKKVLTVSLKHSFTRRARTTFITMTHTDREKERDTLDLCGALMVTDDHQSDWLNLFINVSLMFHYHVWQDLSVCCCIYCVMMKWGFVVFLLHRALLYPSKLSGCHVSSCSVSLAPSQICVKYVLKRTIWMIVLSWEKHRY